MPRFWKLTDHFENHNGLQYHDGRVDDIIPFNSDKTQSCVPGGIYFTDTRNVFKFIDFGTWIREVTVPEDAWYLKDPSKPTKYRASSVILGPRRKWFNKEVLEELIGEGAEITPDLLFFLCTHDLESFKYVMGLRVIKTKNIREDLFLQAGWDGNIDALEFLIGFYFKTRMNYKCIHCCFFEAARGGHIGMLEYLYNRFPKVQEFDPWTSPTNNHRLSHREYERFYVRNAETYNFLRTHGMLKDYVVVETGDVNVTVL